MNAQMVEMSQRIARSAVAIIDTMVQRGAARGEELSTLGQLRDQCIALANAIESEQQASAEVPAEEETTSEEES